MSLKVWTYSAYRSVCRAHELIHAATRLQHTGPRFGIVVQGFWGSKRVVLRVWGSGFRATGLGAHSCIPNSESLLLRVCPKPYTA